MSAAPKGTALALYSECFDYSSTAACAAANGN